MTTSNDAPPLITVELLRQLYTGIYTHRAAARARRARALAGREAIDVAFASNLSERDIVFAYRPCLMAAFARSAAATELVNSAVAAPNAVPVEIAAGVAHHVALIAEKDTRRDVVIVLTSARQRTDWNRTFSFAGPQKSPIVFVVEEEVTNQRSAAVERVATTADAYGIPPMYVDGKDTVALFRVAQEAIFRARNGGSPTLVIAHIAAKSGQPRGLAQALTSDALAAMQAHLERKEVWSRDWAAHMRHDVDDRLAGRTHHVAHRKAHNKKQ